MNQFLIANTSHTDIVDLLKKKMQIRDVYQDIVHQRIIEQTAAQRGISVSTEEIQAEGDRIRRQQKLESAKATFAWLEAQLVTAEEWEEGIRDRLLTQKLTHAMFGSDINKYFAEHQIEFDSVLLYQMLIPQEHLATEIYYQIVEEEISFYEAAHLYDIDDQRRWRCGFEGQLYRHALQPVISAAVFSVEPRRVVRPIQSEQGYHLFLVEEFIPAQLTPELEQEIVAKLFKEWLTRELNHLVFS